MAMPGSPVLPVTITPGSTGAGPGGIFLSNPWTRGWEIPSRKPKLGRGSVDIHTDDMKTYCSCPASLPGRTSPLMVMISLMEDLQRKSISLFFSFVVSWLSPEIRMIPCKSWRKCRSQAGVLPSADFGSPRLATASCSWPIMKGSSVPLVASEESSIPN